VRRAARLSLPQGERPLALKLHTIVFSTRPGRVGPSVAKWFHRIARDHAAFDAELVDLAEFNLPLYDEPEHPRLKKYRHEHTKAWSHSVDAADAFVFVTPEYNFSPTPTFVNALDFVYSEWAYKPAAFVSYGGVSGGLRAVQAAKLLVSAVKMVPIVEAVTVPMVSQHLDAEKNFAATEIHEKSARTMLDELSRWAEALKPMRSSSAA
jgi:NAD(P)H-dependent FMN reductase